MNNVAFNSWEEGLLAMDVPSRLSKIMGRIYESGLTTPSGGNCSIRAENGEIWLTPSQIDKGALSPEDMIKCDVSGKFHGKHDPTSEHPFHRLIYNKRHDVNAIVHSHPLSLVSFALSDKKPDCCLLKAIEIFCGKGNIAEYAIPGSKKLGENVARAFANDISWVLMKNHGIITVGRNAVEAYYRMELLERLAEIQLNAKQLHKKTPIKHSTTLINKTIDTKKPLFNDEAPGFVKYMARAAERGFISSVGNIWSSRLPGENFALAYLNFDALNSHNRDICKMDLLSENPNKFIEIHRQMYLQYPHIKSILFCFPPGLSSFLLGNKQFISSTIPESYIMLGDILDFDGTKEIHSQIKTNNSCYLWKNHYAIITGRNDFEVFDRLEVAELTAQSVLKSECLGGFKGLSRNELLEIKKKYLN